MRLSKAALEKLINDPNNLVIDSWETPATKYPLSREGRARITRSPLKKGFYWMEGVRGCGTYYVRNPQGIPVTDLKIGKETVMVDDPLQWYGMQDLAKHCKGKVLVAGLGLGLIIHALQDNRDVTEIHVIERDLDVISLMADNLPQENRKWQIIHADAFWYLEHTGEKYDTVVMDIWWGSASHEIGIGMMIAQTQVKLRQSDARLMIWGHKDPDLNPAVTKEVTLCGVPETP